MEWSMLAALLVVCLAMYCGDVVSTKTGGKIPQLLIVALIFMVGFWTIFPKDILAVSGISTLANIMMAMILIHVGTMFDSKSIIREWKVVVTVLSAIAGILLLTIGVGGLVFGRQTALAAVAPITGGGMAALIISNAAAAAGRPELGLLANMIFIMQGFFGFPLTAWFLNRESKVLLKKFRMSEGETENIAEAVALDQEKPAKRRLYEYLPEKYRTATFYLTELVVLAYFCSLITAWTGFNNAIVQVLLGILLRETGVLEPMPLSKSESNGILTLALFASFMNAFTFATVDVVLKLAATIVGLMLISLVGLLLFAILVGRYLKFSTNMAVLIGLNCYLGFPFNFALTEEAIKANAQTEAEAAMLNGYLMPKMIIAGIISVSLVSAILAGIIAGFIF